MKSKKLLLGMMALMLVLAYAQTATAQTVVLDTAIKNAGDEFSNNLKKGNKVAILAIRSDSTKMSNYIIKELASVIVSKRIVTVVDSVQIGQLQQEMNFQMSGEVSDALAQTVGRKVGAQSVITGSFEQFGNDYRLRLRVIEVETAVITHSVNVKNDTVVASLMVKEPTPAASTPVTSAPTSTPAKSTPATATEPVVTAPQKEKEDYEDFSGGARFGTWVLNALVIPGLGSYVVMNDKKGGGTQLLLWGLGTLGLGIGGFMAYDAVFERSKKDRSSEEADALLIPGIICFSIGGVLWIANGIYNIYRSASYHKPRPEIAALIDPTAWNIALLPGKSGNLERVQVSYTVRY